MTRGKEKAADQHGWKERYEATKALAYSFRKHVSQRDDTIAKFSEINAGLKDGLQESRSELSQAKRRIAELEKEGTLLQLSLSHAQRHAAAENDDAGEDQPLCILHAGIDADEVSCMAVDIAQRMHGRLPCRMITTWM